MPKTHLLIDGDVIAFSAAAAVQRNYKDDFGYMWPFASIAEGEACVENMLWNLKAGLKADSHEVFLSDPTENWRRAVDPNYKTNRTGPRPMLLDHLKDYLAQKHGAVWWEGLEADDTLSILMTTPPGGETYGTRYEGGAVTAYKHKAPDPLPRLICVGRDKDFKTIPGLHHSIRMDIGTSGEYLVREVSKAEADRFHLMQALAGDATDGFHGCPGIGLPRAEKIIAEPVRLVPQEGVKTRGKDKGGAVTRWFSEPTNDYWACIVSHYRKQGLTEAHALITARLARLLRHGDYEDGKVTLWTPEVLIKEGIRP